MYGKNIFLDPRHFQLAVLSSLVVFGIVALDFGIHWYNAAGIAITALAVQWTGTRFAGLAAFDPRSPLITALSLTLLLRTDDVMLAITAAGIAITSKFLLRFNNKHVFNPANVAIVVLILTTDSAWVSTGQWGSTAISALALACLGFIVLTRARRAETTIGFLVCYALLLCGRATWLGDPLSIPVHYLQNGALLIFAFFMISDPKTTPNSSFGRVVFSAVVATIAFTLQFYRYEPNGAILALVIAAPLVPVIDHLFSGQAYQWRTPQLISSLRQSTIPNSEKE